MTETASMTGSEMQFEYPVKGSQTERQMPEEVLSLSNQP
jgi:hypothetical protein